MKTFPLTLALLHLATSTLAAPRAAVVEERQFLASLTFYGAGPRAASFFQQFPADDQLHKINNTLSVSKISSPGGASCTVFGADGSNTFIHGGTVDVGPPQRQISAVCDI